MGYHAVKSPSSAHRWTDCTASIKQSYGCPNESSEAARAGTCCHQMAEELLMNSALDAQDYLDREMGFWHNIFGKSGEDWMENLQTDGTAFSHFIQHKVVVTQRMVDAVMSYVNFVRKQAEINGGEMLIEQKMPIGHMTGETKTIEVDGVEVEVPATGTSDGIILAIEQDMLMTIDAKFGVFPIHASDLIRPAGVDPFDGTPVPEKRRMNLQLAMYMLGAYHEFAWLHDWKHFKAVIVQPFLNHVSEYTCDLEELLEIKAFIEQKAKECDENPVFKPSSDNCKFCPAGQAGKCPERDRAAMEAALDGFEDLETATLKPVVADHNLGALYDKIGLVESWIDTIKTKVIEELRAGKRVVRPDGMTYKLVPGRKGDRKWKDEKAVEEYLKRIRLSKAQIYEHHLISPATAEKLSKPTKKRGKPTVPPVLGPNQWDLLLEHITQAPAKPTIALETDPKERLPSVVDDFEEVEPDPFD